MNYGIFPSLSALHISSIQSSCKFTHCDRGVVWELGVWNELFEIKIQCTIPHNQFVIDDAIHITLKSTLKSIKLQIQVRGKLLVHYFKLMVHRDSGKKLLLLWRLLLLLMVIIIIVHYQGWINKLLQIWVTVLWHSSLRKAVAIAETKPLKQAHMILRHVHTLLLLVLVMAWSCRRLLYYAVRFGTGLCHIVAGLEGRRNGQVAVQLCGPRRLHDFRVELLRRRNDRQITAFVAALETTARQARIHRCHLQVTLRLFGRKLNGWHRRQIRPGHRVRELNQFFTARRTHGRNTHPFVVL